MNLFPLWPLQNKIDKGGERAGFPTGYPSQLKFGQSPGHQFSSPVNGEPHPPPPNPGSPPPPHAHTLPFPHL